MSAEASSENPPVVSEENKEDDGAALSSSAASAAPDLPPEPAEKPEPTTVADEESDPDPSSAPAADAPEPLADSHASLDPIPASSVAAAEENPDFSAEKKGSGDAEAAAHERSLGVGEEAAPSCGDDGDLDGAANDTEPKENGFEAPPKEADKQDESKGEEQQEEGPKKEAESPDESKEEEGEGEGEPTKEEPLNGDASYSAEGKEQEALPSSGVEKLFSRYTKLPFILTGLAIAAAGVALGSISRSSFLRNK